MQSGCLFPAVWHSELKLPVGTFDRCRTASRLALLAGDNDAEEQRKSGEFFQGFGFEHLITSDKVRLGV
jgi:hypothetical protein